MKIYRVRVVETIVHDVPVEAASSAEAEDLAVEMIIDDGCNEYFQGVEERVATAREIASSL